MHFDAREISHANCLTLPLSWPYVILQRSNTSEFDQLCDMAFNETLIFASDQMIDISRHVPLLVFIRDAFVI